MHCTGRLASDRFGNISIQDCIRTSISLELIGKLNLDINIKLGNLLCYDNTNILGQTRKQTTQEYEYLRGFAQAQRKNILHGRGMARIFTMKVTKSQQYLGLLREVTISRNYGQKE